VVVGWPSDCKWRVTGAGEHLNIHELNLSIFWLMDVAHFWFEQCVGLHIGPHVDLLGLRLLGLRLRLGLKLSLSSAQLFKSLTS
jgi:hypothetical protein